MAHKRQMLGYVSLSSGVSAVWLWAYQVGGELERLTTNRIFQPTARRSSLTEIQFLCPG